MHSKSMTSVYSMRIAGGLVMAAMMVFMPVPRAAAQSVVDDIAVFRESLKTDRMATVAEAMQLTEAEGKAFWPLYREYRSALDRTHDGLVELVLEYADVYPNVPEEKAAQMLKDYTALEVESAGIKATYLKKFAKVITAAKALRLAQVENRLDLRLRLQLANIIPLAPVQAK